VNVTDECVSADLLDADAVRAAVRGSDVVYLCAGIDYKLAVWQTQWPRIMRNVIDACSAENARLVFFDNVYVFGADLVGNMTEETPIAPSSKKGAVRATLYSMIMDAVKEGRLHAIVARSADFYGPIDKNSAMLELIYKNIKAGRRPMWFGSASVKHSHTFTPDAARATAMLGNTLDAYDQVWNLPTSHEALTGQQWATLFAEAMHKPVLPVRTIPPFLLTLMGLFMPLMRELKEMLYQYDRDYVFDSSKFERRYKYIPTTPRAGVAATVKALGS
jgi:nucleoside-diphosphate-sugar epimerase